MMKELTIGSESVEVTDSDVISILTDKISKDHNPIPETCYAIAIGDLGEVIENYHSWQLGLPLVEPFYVVRCNDDPAILSVLSQLGAGFVCSSKAEMQKLLKLHVPLSKIIYGSAFRPSSQLHFAIQQGIDLLTFESIHELHKISSRHPNAQLILRVNSVADNCINQEGVEFGCHPCDVTDILTAAKQLGVDVVGVSVCVGEDNQNASTIDSSMALGRAVFSLGDELGFNMTILGVSGDFIPSKTAGSQLNKFAHELCSSLDLYFADRQSLRVIAECGSYLVKSAFTVAVDVLAEATVVDDANHGDVGADALKNVYYVSDGVYGLFSHCLVDRADRQPVVLNQSKSMNQPSYTSSVWGPTCDSLDCILPECRLPRLDVGDWLAFGDMGWFLRSADDKNGNINVARHYVISERKWLQLCLMAEPVSSQHCERTVSLPSSASYKSLHCNWPST